MYDFNKKSVAVIHLIIIFLSFLFSIFLIEISLRIKEEIDKKRKQSVEVNAGLSILQKSEIPGLGYEYKRNVTKTFLGPEGDPVTYVFNEQGFRGESVSMKKERDEIRILILGDSVSFGLGVDDERIFSKRIENFYQSSGKNVRVINGAVGGYTTLNELIIYKEKYRAYKPDIVLLGYFINDADPNSDFIFDEVTGENKNIQNSSLIFSGLFGGRFARIGWIIDRFRVYNFLSKTISKLTRENGWYRGATELDVEGFVSNPDGWMKRKEYLLEMRDTTVKDGASFLIIIFPTQYQIDHPIDFPEPQQILRDFSMQHAIPYIDFLEIFTADGKQAEKYLFDNAHLTIYGHEIVATEIVHFFNSNNWIRE